MLHDQIDSNVIVGAARDDHVGVFLRRQAEVFERGLHVIDIAGEDVLETSAVLLHVAQDSTCETRVGIGVDEQFHLEEVLMRRELKTIDGQEKSSTYANLREVEHENAFDDDYRDRLDGVESAFDMFVLARVVTSDLDAQDTSC